MVMFPDEGALNVSDTSCQSNVPDSPEAYYQEAGRGGRDGKRSYAVVIFHQPDLTYLDESLEKKFPSLKEVRQVYRALGNYFQLAVGAGAGFSYDFDVVEFAKRYQLDVVKTQHYSATTLLRSVPTGPIST